MTSFQKAPRIVWPREGLSSAIERKGATPNKAGAPVDPFLHFCWMYQESLVSALMLAAMGLTTLAMTDTKAKLECTCGFVGLRHTPICSLYPLTAEGGFAGAYPPGGGDDDSDLD